MVIVMVQIGSEFDKSETSVYYVFFTKTPTMRSFSEVEIERLIEIRL